MKTKFDPLVQYQKQKLQLCETQIARLNAQVVNISTLIESLCEKLTEIKPPKIATFESFLRINEIKKMHISEITSLQNQSQSHKQEIATLKDTYKALHIEFEKLKYLQEKEQEKIFALLKRKEQRDLDETAILLYQKENA